MKFASGANGRNSGKKVSNLPLMISESTANIQSVMEMVAADTFNGEAAVILDNKYLYIPNTPNTMGKCKCFWS